MNTLEQRAKARENAEKGIFPVDYPTEQLVAQAELLTDSAAANRRTITEAQRMLVRDQDHLACIHIELARRERTAK